MGSSIVVAFLAVFSAGLSQPAGPEPKVNIDPVASGEEKRDALSLSMSYRVAGLDDVGESFELTFDEKRRSLDLLWRKWDEPKMRVAVGPEHMSDTHVAAVRAGCGQMRSRKPPLIRANVVISPECPMIVDVRGGDVAFRTRAITCQPAGLPHLIAPLCAILEQDGVRGGEEAGAFLRGFSGPETSEAPPTDDMIITVANLEQWRKLLLSPPQEAISILHYGFEDLAASKDPGDRAFLKTVYRKLQSALGENDPDLHIRHTAAILAREMMTHGEFEFLVGYIRFFVNENCGMAPDELNEVSNLVNADEFRKIVEKIKTIPEDHSMSAGLKELLAWLGKNRQRLQWQGTEWVLQESRVPSLQSVAPGREGACE